MVCEAWGFWDRAVPVIGATANTATQAETDTGWWYCRYEILRTKHEFWAVVQRPIPRKL